MSPTVWAAVRAAAAGRAGAVRDLATVAGVPRLGWVDPPPWPVVARVLRRFDDLPPRVTVLGTGGWAFGAAAAGARVVDVLDPARLAGIGAGPVLAVSESGRTRETRLLADAAAARGADVCWLRGTDLWPDPDAPSVALFAAPVSVPFLLAARGGPISSADSIDPAPLSAEYRRFVELTGRIGRWAAHASGRVPRAGRVRVVLPAAGPGGLHRFVLQALRQGLSGNGGPWFDVTTGPGPGLRLPAWPAGPLARVMAHCYAVSALVACVGVRLGIPFAEHPGVERYKRLIGTPGPEPVPVPADGVAGHAVAWLAGTGLRRGHLVRYDAAGPDAAPPGWEIHPGSTWNHHSFTAVAAEPEVGVVAVLPAAPTGDPLTAAQAGIAAATCAALAPRSLLLRPLGGTP